MTVNIHPGDCVQWAREYTGEPFHALLCDPPYHLTSVTKNGAAGFFNPDNKGQTESPFPGSRNANKGFMGKDWDGGDIAFDPATWEAFKRIMYPGAFGMAFASSRGWHRLACAIEDAGFVIHPSLFGWAYGSGFPKATRVDTQIDKAAGAERTEYDIDENFLRRNPDSGASENGIINKGHFDGVDAAKRYKPATDLARAFAGHRYGLQALKPALEPIIVFQKPYAGRPIDNITATGAGALAIDNARIETDGAPKSKFPVGDNYANSGYEHGIKGRREAHTENLGRWPANFYLDAEAARRLDEQSGERSSRLFQMNRKNTTNEGNFMTSQEYEPVGGYSDSGGASRFFFRVAEQLDDADPVRYVAKASRRERDAGLEGMPGHMPPQVKPNRLRCANCGGWQNVGGVGASNRPNSTCSCSSPDYEEQTGRVAEMRNSHPTVKPIALTRYLATLLLPPVEYAPRRLFVPFAGVASEIIGAMLAGWECVEGVELTDEYIPIAQARVKHYTTRQLELIDER